MKAFAVAALAAFVSLCTMSAAHASTIPPVDLDGGRISLALGLADVTVDHALTDRLSIGATGIFLGIGVSGALRTTLRLGQIAGMTWGVTASLGDTRGVGAHYQWFQPAINVAIPLDAPRSWTVRATAGPMFTLPLGPHSLSLSSPGQEWLQVVAPNLELAWRVAPGHEVTFGGNALAGWRGVF